MISSEDKLSVTQLTLQIFQHKATQIIKNSTLQRFIDHSTEQIIKKISKHVLKREKFS